MIWSWIFQFLLIMINALIGLLPTVTDSSGFGSAVSTASTYIAVPYSFLPFITGTLLAIVVFDITFETSYLFYKAIYWVIRRFPTQS